MLKLTVLVLVLLFVIPSFQQCHKTCNTCMGTYKTDCLTCKSNAHRKNVKTNPPMTWEDTGTATLTSHTPSSQTDDKTYLGPQFDIEMSDTVFWEFTLSNSQILPGHWTYDFSFIAGVASQQFYTSGNPTSTVVGCPADNDGYSWGYIRDNGAKLWYPLTPCVVSECASGYGQSYMTDGLKIGVKILWEHVIYYVDGVVATTGNAVAYDTSGSSFKLAVTTLARTTATLNRVEYLYQCECDTGFEMDVNGNCISECSGGNVRHPCSGVCVAESSLTCADSSCNTLDKCQFCEESDFQFRFFRYISCANSGAGACLDMDANSCSDVCGTSNAERHACCDDNFIKFPSTFMGYNLYPQGWVTCSSECASIYSGNPCRTSCTTDAAGCQECSELWGKTWAWNPCPATYRCDENVNCASCENPTDCTSCDGVASYTYGWDSCTFVCKRWATTTDCTDSCFDTESLCGNCSVIQNENLKWLSCIDQCVPVGQDCDTTDDTTTGGGEDTEVDPADETLVQGETQSQQPDETLAQGETQSQQPDETTGSHADETTTSTPQDTMIVGSGKMIQACVFVMLAVYLLLL